MKTEYKTIQIQNIDAEILLANFRRLEEQITKLQMSSQTPIDKLISTEEAAKLLSVTKVTIHNWIKSGVLKGYRIGNILRLKENEVLDTLQAVG